MAAGVIGKLYTFFGRIMYHGEHALHMNEFELVLTVIGILIVLLVLVVWWRRRVERYNEAVWRAGRYTANDPYKERDMLRVARPRDPWIVADPIGGSEVGEAMEVESLTDFMKKAAPIQSSVDLDNDAVTVIRGESTTRSTTRSSKIDESLPARAEVPVFHESGSGVRPAPDRGLSTLRREAPTKAGWYPDPSGMEGFFRYWDGNRWTGSISKKERYQSSSSSDIASPGVDDTKSGLAGTAPASGNVSSLQESHSPGAESSGGDSNRDVII